MIANTHGLCTREQAVRVSACIAAYNFAHTFFRQLFAELDANGIHFRQIVLRTFGLDPAVRRYFRIVSHEQDAVGDECPRAEK